jgi:hypothetical protein
MPDASLLTSIRNSSAIVAAGLSSGGLPKHNISGSVTSSLKQVGRSAPPSNVTFSSFGGPPSVSFRIDNSSFAPLSNEQLQRLSNEYFSLLGLNPSSVKLTLTEGSIVVNFVYSSGTNVNTLSTNEIGIINNLANSFADGATTLQEFRTAINRANLNAYFSITAATVSAVTINVSPSLNNIINARAPGVDPTMVVFSRLGNMYTVAEGTLLETDVTSGISRKIIGNIPAPTYQTQYSFRTFYFIGISSDDKYLTFSDSIFFLNTIESFGGIPEPQTTIHRVNLFTKEYELVDMFSSPTRVEENIFYNPYNDTIYDAQAKTIGVLDSYRFTGLNTFVKEDSALKFYKEVPLTKQIYLNQNTMLFYENNVIKRVNLSSGVVTTLMSTPHVPNPSKPASVTYNYTPANGPIKFARLADFSPIRHYSEFYDTLQVLDVYTGVLILITGLLTSTPSIESIYGTPRPKDAQGYIPEEKYLPPNAKNTGKLSEGLNWTIPSQHYIDRYKDNSFVINASSPSVPVITKSSDYWKLFSLYIIDGVYSREFKLFNVTPKPDDLVFELSSNGLFYICTGHVLGKNATGSILIPDTYRDKPVRQVGAGPLKGFQDYLGITELYIPDSVTVIGDNAFTGCLNLKGKFQLPTNLEEIGLEAFKGCRNLESQLALPSSLKRLGVSAFNGCEKLTGNITIPGGLTFCGNSAFFGCIGLESVAFGNGNTIIPDFLFQGCSGLKTLTFSNTITSIGANAFSGCVEIMQSLSIPDSVTIIGNEAFYGCTKLIGSLIIGNGVTRIGRLAFSGCSRFDGSLIIPNSVNRIDQYAFEGCTGFTGILTIPESISEISDGAFSKCENLNTLKLPSSIVRINTKAFANSFRLAGTLYIPLSVNLANDAFIGDPLIIIIRGNPPPPPPPSFADRLILQLQGNSYYSVVGVRDPETIGPLVIPTLANDGKPIKSINTDAFKGNKNITALTIQEGIFNINSGAFQNCEGIQSISLPESLIVIDEMAFADCSASKTITFAPNCQLKVLRSYAFYKCGRILNELVLPDGPYASFGNNVFEQCIFLEGIRTTNNFKNPASNYLMLDAEGANYALLGVNKSYFNIRTGDDKYMYALDESEGIPVDNNSNPLEDNVLPRCTFARCEITGNVSLSGINIIDDQAFLFSKFNNITLTFNNLRRIHYEAFTYLRGTATTFNFPNSLEYIGHRAFYVPDQTHPSSSIYVGDLKMMFDDPNRIFTIPPNVTTIAEFAFGNVRLKNIILPTALTVIGSNAFNNAIIEDDFVIPNSVVQIHAKAFAKTLFKKKVIMSSNIEYLDWNSFLYTTVLGRRSLAESILPPSLRYAGGNAIHDIESVVLNGSVASTTVAVEFRGYGDEWYNPVSKAYVKIKRNPSVLTIETDGIYSYVLLSSNTYKLVYSDYDKFNEDSKITIPDVFNGKPVTHIGDYAFSASETYTPSWLTYKISGFTFSNNLTHIGKYAFYNNSFLHGTIIIPDSVTTIGEHAFDCLTINGYVDPKANNRIDRPLAFVVGAGITSMGKQVFHPNTTSIQFRNGCQVIGPRAFIACRKASSVTNPIIIPPSVTTIGSYAFFEQTVRMTTKLSNLTRIGKGAFGKATIIGFDINNSITKLYANTFYRCKFEGQIAFPTGLTHIGDYMFSYNSSVIGPLNLPSTVISIGDYAFYRHYAITQINLPTNLIRIGAQAFRDCTGAIGQLTIPSGITRIEYGAFQNCPGLSGTLIIPSTVTYIGPFAFENCSNINTLIIQGTPRIEALAFQACTKMSGSYTRGTNYVDSLAFQGCPLFTIV